jgi:C-terminal processing protease CtpA/Prc
VVVLTDRGHRERGRGPRADAPRLPNVEVVGDTTSGTASQPLPRQLPNGWWLRVPATLESTPDGALVVEGRGAPADGRRAGRPADLARDWDRVLAAALARLSGYEVF